MSERMLTEREAFRAARYFVEQFNERERSEALELLVGWMSEGWWDHDPLETSDPAQWHDWIASVEATYHRWRNQFGGMKADDAKRLRELERENTRLKRCRR